MAVSTLEAKPKYYAGLYMRTGKRTLFWGWKSQKPVEVEVEVQPPSTLAEWLRMAHTLLDDDGGKRPARR